MPFSADEIIAESRDLLQDPALAPVVARSLQVCICDAQGLITEANTSFCTASEYPGEALIGRPYAHLVSEGQKPDFTRERWARVLAGEAWRGAVALRSRHGREYWCGVTLTPLPGEPGTPPRCLVLGLAIGHTGRGLARPLRDNEGRNSPDAGHDHPQADAGQLLRQIMDGSPVPTFVIDAHHTITHWNRACTTVTGHQPEEMVGQREAWRAFYPSARPVLADIVVDDADLDARIGSFYADSFRCSPVIPGAFETEQFFPHLGTAGRWLFFTAAPLRDATGRVMGAIETLIDVGERKAAEDALRSAHGQLESLVERRTAQLFHAKQALEEDVLRRERSEQELRRSNAELQSLAQRLGEAHQQLVQSEKLASIGQLAAGVAHEINNPLGYLKSNLGSLERYLADLTAVLQAQTTALAELPPAHPARQAVQQLRQTLDFDFTLEDLPALLQQSREGLDRVSDIVTNLKDFSRPDSGQVWQWCDLHRGLESTLVIAHNEIKHHAEVERDYAPTPEIECLPSELNQVFLNLLVNAAQAIPEGRLGRIRVRTAHQPDATGGQVSVEISDDGCGIPPEQLPRIFDPFFTTKPVGKGTGLGLSLSYGIVHKHHGEIQVSSTPGGGTTFRVVLPVRQNREPSA